MNIDVLYGITFGGEFENKDLEKKFFNDDMQRYSKIIGPVALVFGVIFMLFLLPDYFDNRTSFYMILMIRTLVLAASIGFYFASKNLIHYSSLTYWIAGYQFFVIMSFIIILDFYNSLTFFSYLSLIVVTMAIYITPNKLNFATIISLLLSFYFFTVYIKRIDGMEGDVLFKTVAYHVIIIVFSYIGAYVTNVYKRKQFLSRHLLEKLSITDPLTGIFNRLKMSQEIDYWIHNCNKYNDSICVGMLDIDNFKTINDTYGHPMGDLVIQRIVSIINQEIRKTDVFARWGGEEFILLLPNTNKQQAIEILDRLRASIQNNDYGLLEPVTCSFGLVSIRKNESSDSLLNRVDKLLYQAKDRGKNNVVYELESSEE